MLDGLSNGEALLLRLANHLWSFTRGRELFQAMLDELPSEPALSLRWETPLKKLMRDGPRGVYWD